MTGDRVGRSDVTGRPIGWREQPALPRLKANAVLMHEPLRLQHGHFLRAGHDLAPHQVADVQVDERGSVLGERTHHIALRDYSDQRPVGVADRKGADVERTEPRADGRAPFFRNAGP